MRTVIKNGRIIDPGNRIDNFLNLLLEDGKVTEMTKQQNIPCDKEIDAEGLIVCPGFVDIHYHEDPYDKETGKIAAGITLAALKMGVTTSIGGNCGINVENPSTYLDAVDRDGMPVNTGLFCGHTFFRECAGASDKYGAITPDQLAAMKSLMADSLESGCFGVSFGIRYVPGMDHHELLEIGKLLVGTGKLLTAHVRDDAAGIFKAVRELTDVALELDVPVQNSHVGSMGGYGQMEQLLAELDALRANGLDVTSDCYPYYAFSTRIGQATYDDGFLERYKADYDVIEICDGPYKGQRCTEAIFRELRRDAPETLTVCHVMKDTDVDYALMHPAVFVASDGLMDNGQGHPRAAGTFPRFLHNYVSTGQINLYTAIEKMATLPARKLGLSAKGHLGKGADGDVLIFDPKQVQDRATFLEPLSEPEGIRHVFINGQEALRDGSILNAALGRAVRRF